ncbi:MAG: DNA helicase RecQ [Phycisphaeraceae bacterium]
MDASAVTNLSQLDGRVAEALQRYWGFDALRPLQAEAIEAGLEQRDSLVVLPTGGGKSLCYQIPPIVADRLDVVVSPLIALMKDQVDGLREAGYPAAAIHSNLDADERSQVWQDLREDRVRLLFVTPERLLTEHFLHLLDQYGVRSFAIDEAHCISQWGHDFRPEYRQLAALKQRFPGASLHAYTATATERVQQDIVEQLGLREPRVIIGRFDRPNLVYRVLPAQDVARQTLEAVQRHANEAVIVYCLSRNDTEAMAESLRAHDIRAAHYHAGMANGERRRVQDDFAGERIDVVCATVAFGMGIDRSNVRCIVHATMPKSVEHYQQETGRAGRDGLEAECVLLYSGSDVMRWESLMRKSAEEADDPEAVVAPQLELLRQMQRFCNTLQCRHRALSRYFGQEYEHDNCGACDVCLGEVEGMADSVTVAQKVLSCVYRLGRPYGARYLVQVLRGSQMQEIKQRGHDQLSTHGLLRDMPEKKLQHIVYQLVDLGLLQRTGDDYPTLILTAAARDVLRGERTVQLIDPQVAAARKTRADEDAWAGVDRELFEHLRGIRRELAQERGVPPYVIFGDATLRELARVRPTSLQSMQHIRGVGEKKLDAFGTTFLSAIREQCDARGLSTDQVGQAPAPEPRPRGKKPNPRKEQAMAMFAEGADIDEIVRTIDRAPSTVFGYLLEYVEREKPASIARWVDDALYQRIVEAAGAVAADRLRPIYEYLNGEVPYEQIRLVLTHHRAVVSQSE